MTLGEPTYLNSPWENPQGVVSEYNSGLSLLCIGITNEPEQV